ncbi:MAG: hypothetical protein LBM23_10165 [Propionibacteriaceae bacterium]|jgi:hypothetical protein|nr:hypothetical protein [Propionibacteriaceae bacterium]
MASSPSALTRFLSLLVAIAGALMLLIGASVYIFTSSQLSAQGITVSAVTAEDPGPLAGDDVNGPFSALAQANAIKEHSFARSGGKTYAELGNVATSDGKTYNRDVEASASTDGAAHKVGDELSEEDAATYSARQTAMNASFLQASLFVSVLAFGVSALIMGLGVVVLIVGIVLLRLVGRRPVAAAATAAGE